MTQPRFFIVLATAFVVTFTVTSLRNSKQSSNGGAGLPMGMQFYETTAGLEVATLKPRAKKFGFEPGDVIQSINQMGVNDYRSLRAAINEMSSGDMLNVTVKRGESLLTISRRFEGAIKPLPDAKALMWKEETRRDGVRVIDELPEHLVADPDGPEEYPEETGASSVETLPIESLAGDEPTEGGAFDEDAPDDGFGGGFEDELPGDDLLGDDDLASGNAGVDAGDESTSDSDNGWGQDDSIDEQWATPSDLANGESNSEPDDELLTNDGSNVEDSEFGSGEFSSTDSLLTQDAPAEENIDSPSFIEDDTSETPEEIPSPSDRAGDSESGVVDNPWVGREPDYRDDGDMPEEELTDDPEPSPATRPEIANDESFSGEGYDDESELLDAPLANRGESAFAPQENYSTDGFGPPPVGAWTDGQGPIYHQEGYNDYTPIASSPTWRDLTYYGGWLSGGYHSESNDLFNDRPDEFNFHQGWLLLGKDTAACSRFGGRVDVMYGIDGDEAQAFGNTPGVWDFQNGFDFGSYAWAIPQAYGQVGGDSWDVRAGRFVTILGFESIAATSNFFYSRSMAFNLIEPRTHTGVLGRKQFSQRYEIFAGWTLGADTGFDQFGDGSTWLGGTRVWLTDNVRWSSSTTAGDLGRRGADGVIQTYLLEVHLTQNIHTVTQADLMRVDATGEDSVAVLQYVFFNVAKPLRLGTRFEWFKGDSLTGYAPHGGIIPMNAGNLSYYSVTTGANVNPSKRLVIRPEFRYDWSPAVDYDQAYFGIDAILQF